MTKIHHNFFTEETGNLAYQPLKDEVRRTLEQLDLLIYYRTLRKARKRYRITRLIKQAITLLKPVQS